jgi:hypothetical protein
MRSMVRVAGSRLMATAADSISIAAVPPSMVNPFSWPEESSCSTRRGLAKAVAVACFAETVLGMGGASQPGRTPIAKARCGRE